MNNKHHGQCFRDTADLPASPAHSPRRRTVQHNQNTWFPSIDLVALADNNNTGNIVLRQDTLVLANINDYQPEMVRLRRRQ